MRVWIRSTLPMQDDSDLGGHRQPWIFRESTERHRITYENVLPPGSQHDWTGRASQPILRQRLATLPPDEIVLVTDCWDVFFCAGLAEVERKFLEAETPVLFSAETYCFPPESMAFGLPTAPTRFRFPNGGQFIGRAGPLLAMLSDPEFWPDGVNCDQQAYARWWADHPDTVKVDHRCRLFQTLFNDWNSGPGITYSLHVVEIDNAKRYFNSETNSYPTMVHGNGGCAITAAELWKAIR